MIIEFSLYILLLTTAILALEAKNLLTAVVITSAYSFTIALLFVWMGAVDVGFTEAVVGAGVVGVIFMAALARTTQRTVD